MKTVEGNLGFSASEKFFDAVRTLLHNDVSIEIEGDHFMLVVDCDGGDEFVTFLQREERYWEKDLDLWLLFAHEWCLSRGYAAEVSVVGNWFQRSVWRRFLWAGQSVMKRRTKEEMFFGSANSR